MHISCLCLPRFFSLIACLGLIFMPACLEAESEQQQEPKLKQESKLELGQKLEEGEESPSKVVECSYIYWDGVPEKKLFFRMGDQYHPLMFRNGARSNGISVARMDAFQVFREERNSTKEAPRYQWLGEAPIPHDVSKLLFLIIAPDEDDGKHRVIALNDSVDAFTHRTFRFVNLTEQMISIEFAGEIQDVDVDGDVVMQTNVDEKGGFIPCIMRNPEGKTIFGTRLFCQPKSRELVFIKPAIRVGTDIPRLRFFNDRAAPPVAEEK